MGSRVLWHLLVDGPTCVYLFAGTAISSFWRLPSLANWWSALLWLAAALQLRCRCCFSDLALAPGLRHQRRNCSTRAPFSYFTGLLFLIVDIDTIRELAPALQRSLQLLDKVPFCTILQTTFQDLSICFECFGSRNFFICWTVTWIRCTDPDTISVPIPSYAQHTSLLGTLLCHWIHPDIPPKRAVEWGLRCRHGQRGSRGIPMGTFCKRTCRGAPICLRACTNQQE